MNPLNCRKVSGLLSAYLDQELTGDETECVSAHLDVCPLCRSEYDSLKETKRLLASLALQTPREELEQLLQSSCQSRHPLQRLLPDWLSDRLAYWGSVLAEDGARPSRTAESSRGRALAATALFSVAGLCLASASLNGPRDESLVSGSSISVYPLTLGSHLAHEVRVSSGSGLLSPLPAAGTVTVVSATRDSAAAAAGAVLGRGTFGNLIAASGPPIPVAGPGYPASDLRRGSAAAAAAAVAATHQHHPIYAPSAYAPPATVGGGAAAGTYYYSQYPQHEWSVGPQHYGVPTPVQRQQAYQAASR